MFRYFKEHDYLVSYPYHGIYYIEGNVLFPTQIVVIKELNWAEHIWLSSLSDKLEKQDLYDLLVEVNKLHEKAEREYAESVLEVGLGANKQIVQELIGYGSMSGELLEIMKPIIEPVRKESIKGTVNILRNFGHSDKEIKSAIIEQYQLSEEEANSYMM